MNPILNAVTDERYVLALKEAQLVDEAVNKEDEKMLKKPLLGNYCENSQKSPIILFELEFFLN